MINLQQNSNIRRIDELGRVVIPKDIRKKMHIKDNEPLEIFIEGEEIKIKKYSSLPDVIEFIRYLVDLGNRITEHFFIVTDREKVIAATDTSLISLELDPKIEEQILNCSIEKNKEIEYRIGQKEISGKANILPIIVDNDRSGIIIEYDASDIKNDDTIKIFKNLIESRLNNY